jgi:hypothetical protein
MANANFQKLIDAQKDVSIKRKAKIAEAANEYVVDKQIELGYGPSYYKKHNINRAALNVVKDFQKDIYSIEEGGYSDFKNWITKWRSYEKTATGTRSPYDEPEKLYIKSILDPTLKVIASQGGMSLRTTYAAEAILKSLKPLNLLEIMTRRVPFINNMVQDYMAAKDQGEAMAASRFKMERQQANEERLRLKEEKELGTGEQVGAGVAAEFGGPATAGEKIVGGLADVAGVPKGIQAAAKGTAELFGKGARTIGQATGLFKKKKPLAQKLASALTGKKLGGGEEARKEADTQREESQDLFEKIEENTKATAEALGAKKTGGIKDFLAGFLGGKMSGKKLLAMMGISGGALTLMGTLGKVIFSGVTALISGVVWAIMDGFKGSKMFGGVSGFIGGFIGGLDSGVKGMFKGMGKWALIGAGIGSIVPGFGTMVGGLIGALFGGVMGWFGGEKITAFINKIVAVPKAMFQIIIDVLKKAGVLVKKGITIYVETMTKLAKAIFAPIVWMFKKIQNGIKHIINFYIAGINKLLPKKWEIPYLDIDSGKKEESDLIKAPGADDIIYQKHSRFTTLDQAAKDVAAVRADSGRATNIALDNRKNINTANTSFVSMSRSSKNYKSVDAAELLYGTTF